VQPGASYTRVLVSGDADDRELTVGAAVPLGCGASAVVDGVASLEARGWLVETILERETDAAGLLLLAPRLEAGWNEGCVTRGHDGLNHVALALTGVAPMTASADLVLETAQDPDAALVALGTYPEWSPPDDVARLAADPSSAPLRDDRRFRPPLDRDPACDHRGLMETLSTRAARRLALARAGLLKPGWTGLPRRAAGRGRRARRAAHEVIRAFGYLQLDTVSVAGARSHGLVLASRLDGFDPRFAEELLQPGEPLFEYWGHEASWLPIELYRVLGFRRAELRHHPWWGDVVGQHPEVADRLRRRIRDEGPLRTVDMEGSGGAGWWNLKTAKRVASALWSSGELAIRERRAFERVYDLAERVIPEPWREIVVGVDEAIERLVLEALRGHGWATTGTVARTWRLKRREHAVDAAVERLEARGEVASCALVGDEGRRTAGWIRPADLDLAARLGRVRPRRDRGVLLSPFDPVLWDRARVDALFGFHQVLEIFKPAADRVYGYYCLPVLAGEHLVARVDLKADRRAGVLRVVARHDEDPGGRGWTAAEADAAVASALERYARSIGLELG